jgi:hypothetical protein
MKTIWTLGHLSKRTQFSYPGSMSTEVALIQSGKPQSMPHSSVPHWPRFGAEESRAASKRTIRPGAASGNGCKVNRRGSRGGLSLAMVHLLQPSDVQKAGSRVTWWAWRFGWSFLSERNRLSPNATVE